MADQENLHGAQGAGFATTSTPNVHDTEGTPSSQPTFSFSPALHSITGSTTWYDELLNAHPNLPSRVGGLDVARFIDTQIQKALSAAIAEGYQGGRHKWVREIKLRALHEHVTAHPALCDFWTPSEEVVVASVVTRFNFLYTRSKSDPDLSHRTCSRTPAVRNYRKSLTDRQEASESSRSMRNRTRASQNDGHTSPADIEELSTNDDASVSDEEEYSLYDETESQETRGTKASRGHNKEKAHSSRGTEPSCGMNDDEQPKASETAPSGGAPVPNTNGPGPDRQDQAAVTYFVRTQWIGHDLTVYYAASNDIEVTSKMSPDELSHLILADAESFAPYHNLQFLGANVLENVVALNGSRFRTWVQRYASRAPDGCLAVLWIVDKDDFSASSEKEKMYISTAQKLQVQLSLEE